jgi:hypothetical protein
MLLGPGTASTKATFNDGTSRTNRPAKADPTTPPPTITTSYDDDEDDDDLAAASADLQKRPDGRNGRSRTRFETTTAATSMVERYEEEYVVAQSMTHS